MPGPFEADALDMPVQLKQGFGRIVAARQRMVDVRAARWETLQRFKNFAKSQLQDFISTTDPVSGQRLADLSAGGDKARGEAAMVLSFFEGTRLRLTVDTSGQYGSESNPPEILGDIGRIIDIIVPVDLSRAEMIFETVAGPKGALHKLDLNEIIARMVDNAVRTVEEEVGEAGRELSVAGGTAAASGPKPVFSFSIG
jgi:hypothetical protein